MIRKLRNLGISAKIFLPIVGGFVLLVVTFVLLIWNLEREKRQAISSIGSTRQIIHLFDQLGEKEKQSELLLTTYRFQPSSGILDEVRKINEDKESILRQVSGHVNTQQGKELVQSYTAYSAGPGASGQMLIEAVNAGQADKIDQSFEKWHIQRRNIDAALADAVVYSTTLLNSDIAAFNRVIAEVLVTYLFILLTTALLTITLYLYMKKLIIAPLKRLTEGARHIAEENLEWNIEVSSSDEIGKLSQAFNEMTVKLNDSYSRLKSLAYSDPLTGVSSRQSLEPKMQEAIKAAAEQKKSIGVLLLDLDRLKKINDTLGHDIGDMVLREVAGRLRSTLRPQDEVIRMGGDEFVVILRDLESAHGAVIAAEKILKAFEENMTLEGHELHVSGSLGVAVYPNDAETISGLLKAADIALYGAKSSGRNRYNLYNKITDLDPSDQLELENHLRAALKRDELKVYFQPMLDLQTNTVVGAEALLRWQHPALGMLLPHEFVPLAEDCGLIHEVSQWVLKIACREGKKWGDKVLGQIRLAVNLSPRQFSENDLVEVIAKVLEDSGFPPSSLALEITESVAMTNLERGKEKLSKLSRMGIAIFIDDFGTGYSSLSSLRDFPVNKIKIDHSFVRHIITDPKDTAMVKAIVNMGHNLNLTVAAEGVETDMQLALLKSLGCDEAQGYFISRPLIGEDFRAWLANYQKNRDQEGNEDEIETAAPPLQDQENDPQEP